MARPSLSDIRSLPDVAQLYRWNLIIAQAPTGVTAPSQALNLRCETTTIPKATNSTFEVNVRGHKVMQNGILTYDHSLSLTFIETVDNTVHQFFKTWREQMWATRTGVAAFPTNQLKGEFILERLNNQDAAVWRYAMHGVMLQDYDVGTLDNVSSDGLRPTLTFTYDFFDDGAA